MLASLILALAVQHPAPPAAAPATPPAYEGAGDFRHPGPASDPSKAINGLRAKFGVGPLVRDPRLDKAARISVDDLVRTGRAHRAMFEAAEAAGIPDGPRPPGSAFLNYTEGAQPGPWFLGDFLRALETFARTDPDEGHLRDFRNPHWTHFGFAEGPGGKTCVVWYGYFPGEVEADRPATPPPARPGPLRSFGRLIESAIAAPRNPIPRRGDADPDDEAVDAILAPSVGIRTPTGNGSGVIVRSRLDGDSYLNTVFTVAHVVSGGGEPAVLLTAYRDGLHAGEPQSYRAVVVRMDRQADAAVLSFRSKEPKPAAEIDWSPRLRLGHRLARVGHGINLAARLDFGHLTHAADRTTLSSVSVYRIAMPTYGGDSGAPVFREGRAIALVDSVQVRQDQGITTSAEMIGYAIPIRAAFRKSDLQ